MIIEEESLSEKIIVNARLDDGTIMGIEHLNYPIYGVQFHPESIKTEYGKEIIGNFINVV